MRLLSFIDGEDGYGAVLAEEGASSALRASEGEVNEASSPTPPEDGRVELETDAGTLQVSWSPVGGVLEFAIGEAVVGVHPIAVTGQECGTSFTGPGVAWDLPDESENAIRTAWAVTSKGSLVVLVSMRGPDDTDHGSELVGAARLIPDADPYGYADPLLSTEYDASGAHTRATLELWPPGEEHPPERGAGRRLVGGSLSAEPGRLEAARFDWSLDGRPAVGAYEILTP